jgi:hypothetical protein
LTNETFSVFRLSRLKALEYVLSHRMKTDKGKVVSGEVSAYAKERSEM